MVRRVRYVLTICAILCLVALVALSLLPARTMPHTGIPKGYDHFIAYFGTGLVLVLALGTRPARLLVSAAGLVGLGGLLELMQALSPGRTPMVSDFLMSASGALLGMLIGIILVVCLRFLRTYTKRRRC